MEEKIKFIDLFAGIGGIRKAFEDEKTRCVFSSEWDKFAVKTYEENFNETPHGDITEIDSETIPSHDLLLAGFPCQPFSSIGKREGFDHETQGTLFFEVLRIIKFHKPKMFLLENVKGLLTMDDGKTIKTIIKSLEELDYNVFYDVLESQNFGVPQKRSRVIIVGFKKETGINSFEFPKSNGKKEVFIKDFLDEKDVKGYSISKHLQDSYLFKKDDGKPEIINENSDYQVKTLVSSYHKIQRLTGTFVEGGETGVRLLSELEVKRIMGFPDDFKVPVSRTQMYRQFGNSVVVPMIEEVAQKMKSEYYERIKQL